MSEPFLIRARPPHSTTLALLGSQGLPFSDIEERHLEQFFYGGNDGSPIGISNLKAQMTTGRCAQ
jgi:hypothetical protein